MTPTTKTFDFIAPEFVAGQWIKARHYGTAEVLEQGFQMQVGTEGYVLKVIDGNHYSPGTVITVSRGAVRHWLDDITA